MTPSVRLSKQEREYAARPTADGRYTIAATIRYDDRCNNGHNTFSITGEIRDALTLRWSGGGCCHGEIAAAFPELAPLIKWHLCSSDGPLHYVANTVYHAGDRDCHGLRAGEKRQIRNGKTGQLAWQLKCSDGRELHELPKYQDGERPTETYTLTWQPWERVGDGKERDLRAARSCAIWPEATDEELTAPGLEERLAARLPKLLEEFRAAVELLGFTY